MLVSRQEKEWSTGRTRRTTSLGARLTACDLNAWLRARRALDDAFAHDGFANRELAIHPCALSGLRRSMWVAGAAQREI